MGTSLEIAQPLTMESYTRIREHNSNAIQSYMITMMVIQYMLKQTVRMLGLRRWIGMECSWTALPTGGWAGVERPHFWKIPSLRLGASGSTLPFLTDCAYGAPWHLLHCLTLNWLNCLVLTISLCYGKAQQLIIHWIRILSLNGLHHH